MRSYCAAPHELPGTQSRRMTASLASGMALYHQRRFAEAEKDFRAVLAQQPDHLDALIALAAVLIEQQRAAEALPLAERAIKLHPLLRAEGLATFRRWAAKDDKVRY